MLRSTIVLILLALSGLAAAELVVVAPAGLNLKPLSEADVRQIFSGQKTSVGDVAVTPVDLPSDDPVREAFYQKVMQKSSAQMRSYWARMTFTGKGAPPRTVSGPDELRRMLSSGSTPFIGYMDASQVNGNVAVLYRAR